MLVISYDNITRPDCFFRSEHVEDGRETIVHGHWSFPATFRKSVTAVVASSLASRCNVLGF